MRNIVLIKQYFGINYAPLGILFVANALEQAGYNVVLIDSGLSNKKILDVVNKEEPLFVGMSVYTIPTIDKMVEISKYLKQNSDCPVVWGGVHPSLLPEQCLAQDYIDYIVTGEGEEAVVNLAMDLERDGETQNRLRCSGNFIVLDKYEPSWHLVDPNGYIFSEVYRMGGKDFEEKSRQRVFYYIQTARGCPFRCGFCYNVPFHKKHWRAFSIDKVKAQIDFLVESCNCDGITFWDDNFFVDKERTFRILEYLKEKNISFLAEVRASDVNDAFIRALKEYGCLQLFIGGESGSQRVLDIMDKDMEVGEILKVVELGCKYSLQIRISFMFGIPGETIEEIDMTKALIKKVKKYPNVSISGPKLYTPYPATPLYPMALELGFKPPENPEGWSDIHRYMQPSVLPWLQKELDKRNMSLNELLHSS